MRGLDLVNIRLVKDKTLYSQKSINSVKDAVDLMSEELRYYDREVLAVINLQSDMRPINVNIVSVGTTNSSMVEPAQIFKSAILSNATGILIMHNQRRKSMLTA